MQQRDISGWNAVADEHGFIVAYPNLCGHGHFDMSAYTAYFGGKLVDQQYDEAELAMALSGLPSVPA